MVDIFISYRRNTDRHAAGRLRQSLRTAVPRTNVFMDVASIPPGTDFPDLIREKVWCCYVMLAVIGPDWLNVKDDTGQLRLQRENDLVRLEIAEALSRNIRVVPVLVDDAQMPSINKLPQNLQPLCRRQAFALSHDTFENDVRMLAVELRPEFGIMKKLHRFFTSWNVQSSAPSSLLTTVESKVAPDTTQQDFDPSVRSFCQDKVRPLDGGSITATQLYEDYCNWCDQRGFNPTALPSFARNVADFGIRKEKISGRVRYLQIQLI